MTIKEVEKVFDELRAQGQTDEDIAGMLYAMFADDQISLEEFGALADVLGYELNEEFMAMSDEDKKTKGFDVEEDNEAKEDLSKEEIEDAKEVDEGEEEPKEKPEEKKEEPKEGEDEESDDEKAAKLFGFGKK